MRTKFYLQLLLLAATATAYSAYKNTELLWKADFSSAQSLKQWKNSTQATWLAYGGPKGGPIVSFHRSKKGSRRISIKLDPAKLKLHGFIRLEATVRGRGLERAKSYLGPKMMLAYTAKGKKYYLEPAKNVGTYGWETISRVWDIHDHVSKMTLVVGIQDGKGTFKVADIKIFRCEKIDDSAIRKPAVNLEAKAIPRGLGKGAKYRGVMSGRDMSPEAIQILADWNVNLVRYQMNIGINGPKQDISTPVKYLTWIDAEIKRLDQKLPFFRNHGIKVLIDLHTGPGTKINKVSSNVLGESTDLKTLKETWRKLATHYQGNPQIYGYDLLNEPVAEKYLSGAKDPWFTISEQLVKVIRKIDPDTPIVTEPNLRLTHPLPGKHIIYSPHIYMPHEYTYQGIHGSKVRWVYPGMINGVYWDKDQLRVAMKHIIEFQRKHKVPIFIGEFSVVTWAKGGDKYLQDVISLFEEYGWDWTYHAFREYKGWSLEYESPYAHKYVPSADNPRKRAVLEALKKNKTGSHAK